MPFGAILFATFHERNSSSFCPPFFYRLSVYNNKWCTYMSGQVHEIGHNLGLAHSGEGTVAYGDQTGMMVSVYSDCLLGGLLLILPYFGVLSFIILVHG
jgi:hypothetical protein